jgi:hypothetical protein
MCVIEELVFVTKLSFVPVWDVSCSTMNCVEKKVELQSRKWEEYRTTRYYDGDSVLVVELWLHRVADDLSGLTSQKWDP